MKRLALVERRLRSAIAAACFLVIAAPAVAGLLTWQGANPGDWFVGGNWSSGSVPGSGDEAVIYNGTATASSAVNVGLLSLGYAAMALPSGTLESSSAVTVGGATKVGFASNAASSATGTLSVAGADFSTNTLAVGASYGGSATGAVNVKDGAISVLSGALLIGSNEAAGVGAQGSVSALSYNGTHTGILGIGRNLGGGSATGSLQVKNSLGLTSTPNIIEVGFAGPVYDSNSIWQGEGGLKADGTLRAGSGNLVQSNGGKVNVGVHWGAAADEGDGKVSGEISLGSGSLSNLAGAGYINVGMLQADRSGTVNGSVAVAGLSGYSTQQVGVAAGTSGKATGTLIVGAGGISGGSLNVGTSDGGATARGLVEVNGGNVNLGMATLDLGTTKGSAGAASDGILRMSGGQLVAGGILVGNLDSGTGSASGELKLDNVNGRVRSLRVGEGWGASDSSSRGLVQLSRSVLEVGEFIALGTGLSGGDGTLLLADSRLVVGDTSNTLPDMTVGYGPAGNTGRIALQRSLIDVTDNFILGTDARLQIDIGGGNRVSEYGAIDSYTGVLGGTLDVAFGFTPVAPGMVFDLIVSELEDGLSGDFSNVNIAGLAPGYAATYGIEIGNVGGANVEIYRLRITRADAPEPATPLLVLAALAFIWRPARRMARG